MEIIYLTNLCSFCSLHRSFIEFLFLLPQILILTNSFLEFIQKGNGCTKEWPYCGEPAFVTAVILTFSNKKRTHVANLTNDSRESHDSVTVSQCANDQNPKIVSCLTAQIIFCHSSAYSACLCQMGPILSEMIRVCHCLLFKLSIVWFLF